MDRLLSGLVDLAGGEALGADPHPLGTLLGLDPDALKVGEPPPGGLVVGMAHIVPEGDTLSADVALSAHIFSL